MGVENFLQALSMTGYAVKALFIIPSAEIELQAPFLSSWQELRRLERQENSINHPVTSLAISRPDDNEYRPEFVWIQTKQNIFLYKNFFILSQQQQLRMASLVSK